MCDKDVCMNEVDLFFFICCFLCWIVLVLGLFVVGGGVVWGWM